jgi:2-C-methyl-D-erythritol 2,4-cyclodiphosphate synthase
VLVLAAPKIGPIAGELRERVADLLHLSPREVGIKAKTPEGLNLDHVAVAHATVLLESIDMSAGAQRMTASAEIESQIAAQIDGVESLVGGRHDLSRLGRKIPGFNPDDLT